MANRGSRRRKQTQRKNKVRGKESLENKHPSSPGKTETDVRIYTAVNESSRESEIYDVVSRTHRVTFVAFLLAVAMWVATYALVDLTLFLTISGGLVFGGLLSFINSCFNQSRFHYKYLLLNESCSRFIAVLASFLLGRIIAYNGSMAINNLFWICFLLFGIAFCISVFQTNKLKNFLGDRTKHECAELMSPFYAGAPVDAGFNQKECAATSGAAWVALKKDLDNITNRNLSLFFLFFIIVCGLLIFLTLRPASPVGS